jgi:hypothetical protein
MIRGVVMNWYNILKGIFILGGIISVLITVAGWVLIKFIFKSEKYKDKLVEETPLLKCTNVMYTGSILTSIFTGILMVLRFFE